MPAAGARSTSSASSTHPIHDVAGSTIGIVGYGAIGKSVGKRAEALGMRMLPYDVVPQPGLVDFETS